MFFPRPKRDFLASMANVVALFVFLCLLSSDAVHASTVVGTAWLSAPAALWDAAMVHSSVSASSMLLQNAIKSDFATAINALDSGADVTINSLTPNLAPVMGPAYGSETSYTVTTTVLTVAQIEDCLRGATMRNVNSIFASVAPTLSLTVKVMSAEQPSGMTKIMDRYLPLTGITYVWKLVLDILDSAGEAAVSGFVVPLENDLQSTIDSTEKLYLVVVPTDVSTYIVNASSLYVSYTVWSYPTNTAPAAAAGLEATAMTTPLTKLNGFVDGLESSYPALTAYSDMIPAVVKTWTPLIYNPGATDNSDVVVKVKGSVSGNYFLTFMGDADTWGRVWTTQRAAVASTIVAAAEAELVRRNFVTLVDVVDAYTVPNEKKYVGGLQVVCHVSHGYSSDAQHVWGPQDLVSMLLQADYTATQNLYVAAAGATSVKAVRELTRRPFITALASARVTPGGLATTGIQYDFSAKMAPYEIGVIAMAAAIGFLSLVAFFVTCGCYCCCRHCISTKEVKRTAEWEDDLDRYQRGTMSQDAAFAAAERPIDEAKKSRGVPKAVHEKDAATPNPLRPSNAQHLSASCEGEVEVKQKQKQKPTVPRCDDDDDDSADLKNTPLLPIETTQGVPLEALQTSPYSPAEGNPYTRYYDAASVQPQPQSSPSAATAAAAAPPQEDDGCTGSHGTAEGGGDAAVDRHTRKPRQMPNKALAMPQPLSPSREPPTTSAAEGAGHTLSYMANITPTPFFNPFPVQDKNASSPDAGGVSQTRLSQGSETHSHGVTPTMPPPPSHPHYESPRMHHAAPQAYPPQEHASPAYSLLPPATTTGAAYPSADLYSGAPVPSVMSPLDGLVSTKALKKAS